MKKLGVIIINYNTPEMTAMAIKRLREHAPALDLEVVLVDNASTEKIPAVEIQELNVTYIENAANLGFARAVNQGLAVLNSEYVLLLNSDVLFIDDTLERMLAKLEHDHSIGLIGPKMIYPDGRRQVSGGYFPTISREFFRLTNLYKIIPCSTLAHENRWQQELFRDGGKIEWLSGGCLLARTAEIKQLGGLDEKYFFGVEDFDLAYRMSVLGKCAYYFAAGKVVHYHGFSSGGPRTVAKLKMERDNFNYFLRKNFPERIVSRCTIKLMQQFKIMLVAMLGGSKLKLVMW